MTSQDTIEKETTESGEKSIDSNNNASPLQPMAADGDTDAGEVTAVEDLSVSVC